MFNPNDLVKGKSDDFIDAKALILNKKPEIVFLDVEIPGGSGLVL